MADLKNNDDNNNEKFNVCVIGIGCMGYGMGLSLLASNATLTVTGYDINKDTVQSFYNESKKVNKTISEEQSPKSMNDAILINDKGKTVVILCLVNESQCDNICFNSDSETNSLINILKNTDSYVIVCSTVTASWCKKAHDKFQKHNIQFIDCPISGGPIRARDGELTIMASNIPSIINIIMPLLKAMGKEGEIHIIDGGAGMGSTAKMVHQLLAGVHIVAAAESLALASKAGLDVKQMYDIVNGAAGCSWMFTDRGSRMIDENNGTICKSALDIFVKDLDIVYKEAKALQSPVPLATNALQQFISGQCLGLGRCDDSQVIKVYEALNGTSSVTTADVKKKGSNDDKNTK